MTSNVMKLDAFTDTYEYAAYELGEERTVYDDTWGWRTYVFVQNSEAATNFALGECVVTEGAVNYWLGNRSAVAGLQNVSVLGIALGVVAFTNYCWLLKKGRGYGLGDGAVAAADVVTSHTAGAMDTWAAGEGAIGVAETDDDAVSLLFSGYFDI